MSLFNVFDIAGTGMSAQSIRLNTTASNLANSDSVSGSAKSVYRAREPVFSAVLNDTTKGYTKGSVEVKGIVESQKPVKSEYQPDNPEANAQGYVFHSNVDSIAEMTNMISASRSYQNNVEIANTSKKLLLQTLRLGN